MNLLDKWLICADCGMQFLWDTGEQAWYLGKKFEHEPKRCKACRGRRRDEQRAKPRQYSMVSCNHCGNQIYVPFIPRGIKPVYCRTCYSTLQA